MDAIRRALQSYWEAIKSLYEEMWLLVIVNLIWAFLTLLFLSPFILLWALLSFPILAIALIFLLPTPPTAGMYYLAHFIVREKRMPGVFMFWEGVRAYWRQSLALFLVGIAGTLLLWFNIEFYANLDGAPWSALSIAFLYALIIWLAMQVYTLPLLMEQTEKRLTLVYRNAFFITMGNLVFNAVFLVLLAVTIGLSVVLTIPMFILTMGFVALYATHGLLAILQAQGLRPPSDEVP